MKKKVLGLLLAACLACGAPVTARADAIIRNEQTVATIESMELPGSDTNADGLATLEKMEEESQKEPEGFDEADSLTPYGTNKDEIFTIVEKPQLYSLDSENLNTSGSTVAEHIAKGTSLSSSTDNAVSLISKDKVLSYMQGASFDPTNCGRRSHIAVVGYDSASSQVKVYVLDAQNEKMVYETVIAEGDKTAWLKEKNSSNKKSGIDTADAMNFFQVTAGDYNHDGRDSAIVYGGCLTGSGDALWEITYDGSTWQAKAIDAGNLLNPSYFASGMISSKTLGDRLGVSLATGDVDSDGTDDLIVVSSVGKRSSSFKNNTNANKACKPYLAVAHGEKGKSIDQLKKAGQTIEQTKDGKTLTMAATGVSAGDIDGDGRDEIVAAGFMNYWTNGNPTNLQTGSTKSTDKVAFTYYDCEVSEGGEFKLTRNGEIRELSGTENVSRISQGSSVRTDDAISSQAWQQFSVECVAFDGIDAKEYIFLNGFVFSFEGNSLVPVMNNQFFNQLINGNFLGYGKKSHDFQYGSTDENFVYSAAVGNFSGSDNGAETLVLSMGYKRHGYATYSFGRVVIRKDAQGKFEVQKPSTKTSSDKNKKGMLFLNKLAEYSDEYGKGLNRLVVAVDKDYDSVVGKYSCTSFAYTDPNVVAVLQASPYFKELGVGVANGTTYSHSESLTRSTGTSKELSYTIGKAAGVTFGPLSVEQSKTYSRGFSEEYTESVTTEYSNNYTCYGLNQVLVRRTLVYYYFYDVLNSKGGFDSSALVVAVPQKPLISQMSMEQYNELAEAYNNKYYDEKDPDGYHMDVITDKLAADYFLNNEGDPFAYPKKFNETVFNGTGIDMSNGVPKQLGHAAGYASQSYTVTTASEKTTTASDGMETQMSYELSQTVGIPFVGGAGVKAAYTRAVGVVTGQSTTTSQMNSTGASGNVENLDDDASLAKYQFNWRLAGWKGGDDLFKDVLFVGYVVTGQDAPVQPVTDLKASYAAGTEGDPGTVTLTWTSPRLGNRRRSISGFDVYRKDGASYIKLNDTPVANAGELKTQQLTVKADPGWGMEATFVVKALCETSGYDSIYSDGARCVLAARVGNGLDEGLDEGVDEGQESNAVLSAIANAAPGAMLRLYNQWSGEHLFTLDVAEAESLVPLGWQAEGSAWTAPEESDTPVWRLYNPYSGDHHYTASEEEYERLGAIGWTKEGVGFYSAGSDGQPIWRLYNPWLTQGTHLYTTDAQEYDYLGSIGWQQEGVAFYGV